MRPISLTMQAFGSYGKKTTIDFTRPSQNLFLITGDTGSGKTTIFDAIVFALYGEASSSANKKDGVILQSQYTGYDMVPFVELTFSDGFGDAREVYTVRRVPRHLRLLTKGKRKGETTAESTKVSLIMPDGTEYNEKETDEKLKEIVGLTKEQFMQIAMIAQGEFVELLRAKSDDKKVIFRRLFGTELYQNIIDELMNRRRAREGEMAVIKTECQTEVSHVVIPEEPEEYEEIREKKRRIQEGSLSVLEDFLGLLENLCQDLARKRRQADEVYARAIKDRDEKREQLAKARVLMDSFAQKDQAVKALADCDKEEKEVEEWKLLIPRLRNARELRVEYGHLLETRKDLEGIRKALKNQEEDLPRRRIAASEAAKREEREKERNEREIALFSQISERVDKARDLFRQMKKMEAELRRCDQEHARISRMAEDLKKEKKKSAVQEQAWQQELEALGNVDQKLAVCRGQKEQVLHLREEAQEFDRIYRDAGSQKKKAERAREEFVKASGLFAEKEKEYLRARRIFLDDQAGILAEQLLEGVPCPVCGSTSHPNPRQKGRDGLETPSQDQVEALEKTRQDYADKEAEASRKCEVANNLYEEKIGRFIEAGKKLRLRLEENLGQVPDQLPPAVAIQLANERYDRVEKEEKALEQQRKDQYRLEKNLEQAKKRQTELDHDIEAAGESLARAAADRQGVRSTLENLEQARNYATEEEALRELREAQTRRDRCQLLYQEAKTKAEQAGADLHQAETLTDKYKKDIPEKEVLLERREAAYQALMADKGLTEDEWQALAQAYGPDRPDQLQKAVEAFGQKKAEAQGKLAAALRTIGDREKPDLDQLESEQRQADDRWKEAEERRNLYREWLRTDQKTAARLAAGMEDRKRIHEEYQAVNNLYQVLSGKVKNGRMDLETFVQRYYLEKILYAANRRFREMSAGQFELRMIDSDQAGQGRNRGLDLMVYSAVTGKEREIRSLSGGESFMAALALALGMADQIQEGTSAINLDVMFVDEGFGSLDDNARNQAIRVLQDMAEGSKMIGIISHVTELQQQIDDQLVIKKDEEGSHASWQIS